MRLPKGYKKLEYIQSSGTQFVDTGFKPNQDSGVTIDFQLNVTSGWQCVFGARNTANNVGSYSLWHSGSAFGFYYSSANATFSNLVGTVRHTVVATKNTAVADGANSVSPTYSNFIANYPLFLFTANSAGQTQNNASMKLYSCQIYDNDTLVRDFVPCQNASGAVGLWDAVNGVFYGNAGTGVFTAGSVVPEIVDESEITELEYIQSSGTQYLDTLFKPSNNTRVIADFEITESTADWACIFGAREASLARCFALFSNSGNPFYCNIGGRTDTYTFTTLSPLGRHFADVNKNEITIDGISTALTARTFQNTSTTIYFCSNNEDGTVSMFCKMKWYSCQIYDNGLLERDYIPAMLENGEVGLYDRVFHEFYRNAGTGEFTAGSEMVHEDYTELEYVESTGAEYVNTHIAFSADNYNRIKFAVEMEANNTSGAYEVNGTGTTGTNCFYIGNYNGTVVYGDGKTDVSTGKSHQNGKCNYAIDAQNGVVSADGMADITFAAVAPTIAVNLIIGGFGRSNGTVTGFAGKFFAALILLDGAEIRIYIPMLHPSGVAGLWDSVNERFYASATTADFIAGPEVSKTPNAPSTFQLDSVNDTSIVVSWQTVANALGYKLWLNSSLIADTTETTVTVTVEPFTCMVLSLVAYNENGNSPVVTLTHQYAPDNPILWLVTDRTAQDVALGNTKGTYNASDLNRVGYAVAYLADQLASCGVTTTVHPKTDWLTTDIPSEQVLVTYLQNVRTLRTALPLVASVPEVPQDMQFFTHTEANDIEMLLVMLDTHITNMLSNVDTSWAVGSTYTGLYAKEAYR